MTKKIIFIGMLSVGVAFAATVVGCDLFGKEEEKCKGDGGCYYFTSNDDYKWCGDKNCAVWESTVPIGTTSLHCDCN
jgi:hypothetical protein